MPAALTPPWKVHTPIREPPGDARERVGDRDGVAVVAHHQHRYSFPAERVVHPADREGRNPTHTLLFENADNAGRDIDRHGCGLLCMEMGSRAVGRRVGTLKYTSIQ